MVITLVLIVALEIVQSKSSQATISKINTLLREFQNGSKRSSESARFRMDRAPFSFPFLVCRDPHHLLSDLPLDLGFRSCEEQEHGTSRNLFAVSRSCVSLSRNHVRLSS